MKIYKFKTKCKTGFENHPLSGIYLYTDEDKYLLDQVKNKVFDYGVGEYEKLKDLHAWSPFEDIKEGTIKYEIFKCIYHAYYTNGLCVYTTNVKYHDIECEVTIISIPTVDKVIAFVITGSDMSQLVDFLRANAIN